MRIGDGVSVGSVGLRQEQNAGEGLAIHILLVNAHRLLLGPQFIWPMCTIH